MNLRLPPLTLSLYLGRHFLMSVLVALGVLALVILCVDFVELVRRAGSRETDISMLMIFEMALLKWPEMLFKIMPFGALIGMMLALTKLSRSHELMVARAAGVSVWQFLMPAWISMFLLGVVALAVINPIGASMLSRFERLEARALTNHASLLSLSSSGLWLRQIEKNHPPITEYILHALRVSEQGKRLSDVTVYAFGTEGVFLSRMDASKAVLEDNQWVLNDAIYSTPGHPPEIVGNAVLRTELTLNEIQNSFSSPETLSFWELPSFISTLEQAGFSGLRHRLHWHKLFSLPCMLLAMVMISAVFALRLKTRRGGLSQLIMAGLSAGFILYFVSDLVYALGLSSTLPVALAAWTPAVISLLLGTGLLLHFEDG